MLIILIVVMCIIHCCNKTNNISIEQYDIEGFARKPMNNIKFGRIPERSAQISRMEKARVAKARADAKKATRVAKARADAEEAARVAKARADAEDNNFFITINDCITTGIVFTFREYIIFVNTIFTFDYDRNLAE